MPTLHGKRGPVRTGEYNSWRAMKQRCAKGKYAERGVIFDPRWHSFEVFYTDMGERPLGCDLGRRDHDLPYCELNCEWQPISENRGNHR
jgi:hypothetical protein